LNFTTRFPQNLRRAGCAAAVLVVFVEMVFDGYDIAPQTTAVLSKRDATIRDGVNVLAQIGVAAAVAIPVLACVNAKLIVSAK
jgi:hypothetical protein